MKSRMLNYLWESYNTECGKVVKNTVSLFFFFLRKSQRFFRQINVFTKELISRNFLNMIAFHSTFPHYTYERQTNLGNKILEITYDCADLFCPIIGSNETHVFWISVMWWSRFRARFDGGFGGFLPFWLVGFWFGVWFCLSIV